MKNEIQGEITTLANFKYFFHPNIHVYLCVLAYICMHNTQRIK